ncbi:MFS transporter [Brevibacterium luteolum]|uniref:MFS transporter n=1 Tax=Brevibacterium luteolum TaxID=199591 RepID=UPI001C2205BE|nr:MFS transporter [Brevibacterium luteolum]MBU8578393.1 MFS transporter [Brevibacterium luteolum]
MSNLDRTTGQQSRTQNVNAPHPPPWKIITAACVGNALEWYDIAVYAYFSVYLAAAFFPSDDPFVSMLLTLGTFALSFFIRPIGALVIGSFADRHGRKPGLTLTILLMFFGTLLIVITPPAHVIGLAAPALIMVARLIQGFAAGGEFGSATSLMMEHLPSRKAFAASWQFASQAASSLLAGLIGISLTTWMPEEALHSWGFRIPFVVGLLVGPVGLYIRRHVPESPEFDKANAPESGIAAIREVLGNQKIRLLVSMGTLAVSTALTYFISYVPTYAVDNLGLAANTGFIAATAGGLVLFIGAPLAGLLADRFGRLPIMLPSAILVFVLVYFLFNLIEASPGLSLLVLLVVVLSLLKAFYYGPMASVLADTFPTRTRGTGLSLGYNLGVAVFGGLTPTIALWLTKTTGHASAPSYWVMLVAALSAAALVSANRLYRIK